jgi:D-aspartate ligase
MNESRGSAVVVGGERALGLGLVRSLGQGGVPVVVIDTDAYEPAMGSRFARRALVPDLSGRRLVDELLKLAASMDVPPVLFLTNDEMVRTASEFRSDLRRAYRFQLPDHDRLISLMHKTSFQRFAEAHGFPVPRSVTIEGREHLKRLSDLVFPCIVKPAIKSRDYVDRQFQRAYRVTSRSEAETVCSEVLPVVPSLVVQEWIEGPDSEIYFCLQYRGADGSTVCSFTGRKLSIWPPDVGVTASCTAAPEAEPVLQPLTERFFETAGFVGMGSMEFKRDARSGRFFMIEPTLGRADWQEEIATLHGANIPLAAYLHQMGLEVPAALPDPAQASWRASWSHARPAQEQGGDRAARPPLSRRYDAYWRLHDPLPAVFYAALVLRPAVSRSIGSLRRAWRRMASRLDQAV